MKTLIAAFCLILLTGCQTSQHTEGRIAFAGGDGSSSDQAVVINDAGFRETWRLQQKVWLERQFPGYREVGQSAMSSGGKHYDLIEVTTAEGQPKTVYFDSTEVFGK